MDGSTFDTIIRSLTLAGSRRHAVVGLLGSALGLLGSRGEEAEAKKGKGKHKKKKKKGRAGCTPICERKVCGSDGCGGSCGECRTGEACASGRCVCVPTCTNRVCGSDGCDGSCGSCTVAGQFCTDTGQCQCPAAIPVVCGGACRAISCRIFEEVVDPERCRCCITNFRDPQGSADNCCSTRVVTGACYGRGPGESCTFNEQCLSYNCAQGTCSGCPKSYDYCTNATDTCLFNASSLCLKTVNGTVHCGTPEWAEPSDCGWCTRDLDCDQGVRPGYFCAVATGPNCNCPQGQTFCAAPA